MTTPIRKKLIEVSIPLEAINAASAKEKSIRHGHPSTVHMWWARRPLAACRAVLFSQLVDDPSSWPGRYPFPNVAGDEDAERRRLHKIIERMVPWEASNNEAILNEARWEIARSVAWGLGEEPPAAGDGKAVLEYLFDKAPAAYDPFSGGGSIPLEAQRLGLRALGSDLNPVAVLISKATIEIPSRFSNRAPVNPNAAAEAKHGQIRAWKRAQGFAEDVRYFGEWMRDRAEERVGSLFPAAILPDASRAKVIAWLWARTVRSPDPAAKGAKVPLVSSFMLSTKEGKKAWVEPIIDPSAPDRFRFEVSSGVISKEREARLSEGTKSGKGQAFVCVLTGSAIPRDYIQSEGKAGRIGSRLLAVVAQSNRQRVFVSPTDEHESFSADPKMVEDIANARQTFLAGPTPTRAEITGGVCSAYGLTTWGDLFTDRQLAVLLTLQSLLVEIPGEVASVVGEVPSQRGLPLAEGGDGTLAYAEAITTILALSLSKMTVFSTNQARWRAGEAKSAPAFGRQGFPMIWDFAEINPFAGAGGDWLEVVSGSARAISEHSAHQFGGKIDLGDARSQTQRGVTICTDPPYYDNIGYAVLADYFYPWLKFGLKDVWPDLVRRISTPKLEELVANSKRQGGKDQAEEFFMSGMKLALGAAGRSSLEDEPIVIFYAFKQSESSDEGVTSAGWSTFLQALFDVGMILEQTWPLRTEGSTRLVAMGSNALASSIVLVCRKRPIDAEVITRADFIRTLKKELPEAIAAIRKAGVGPVDMQQSVIGPGMGVFSRHSMVLEDDDTAMSVKTSLAIINRVWEEIENELDAVFDPETQVALAWYSTYGFEVRQSGELITLANAKNTPSNTLFSSGLFSDLKGKTCLSARADLPSDWTPASDKSLTVWECVQHTARVLSAPDGGGAAASKLVAQMGAKADEARVLAYRLFEVATSKGWTAEARVYNELAQEWTKLEELASELNDDTASAGHQPAFEF